MSLVARREVVVLFVGNPRLLASWHLPVKAKNGRIPHDDHNGYTTVHEDPAIFVPRLAEKL